MTTKTLSLEEIGQLVEKASANYDTVLKQNQDVLTQFKSQGEKFNELKGEFDKLKEGGDNDAMQKMANSLEELREEMDATAGKLKDPINAISDEKQKEAIKTIAKKAIGAFYKQGSKMQTPDFFEFIKDNAEAQCKTLNIATPAQGGLAVAETLDRDVMDYARDFSPILTQIGRKASLTRSYRQMIKITYPSVSEGVEAIAGTVPVETSTQTYTEVKSKEFKLYVSPRITNEALYGTDIDVYSDLVESLGEEIAIYLSAQILKGDGQDKNCRGMYSSNRIDITATTGESWKPTLTPTGTGARKPDFFPVYPTGVDGKIATDDEAKVNWLIDYMSKLPMRYRGTAEFTMHEDVANEWKKVRDGNKDPVFITSHRDGGGFMLMGKPVVIDNTLPTVASDSLFMRYGDTAKAMVINNGDIDQMLLDPYTKKGSTIVYMEKEYFEMVQRSDALIFACATTKSGS
ncbi:coil containing protein [Vibrio phage 1.004.O._10N.261.54.A2]|nr:coil containing protein [Vibrio phage 1.004.O._10N.261.54.A2]AUR83568.1 coil containing protein [Vibrio phage 1.037.O._10N.261.52.F7]